MPSSTGLWRQRARSAAYILTAFLLALWCELFLDRLNAHFTFLAFAPAVALTAALVGFVPGAIVVAASVVASDYYLLGPGRLFSFDSGSQIIALITFALAWVVVAWISGGVALRMQRELEARKAAERTSNQAHRIAQSTAALGQARTSSEAIEASVQEGLHWLGGDAAIFFVLNEEGTQMTVARAVGHALDAGDVFDVDGEGSPFTESARRLVPVVTTSWEESHPDYAKWASRGPWRRYPASVILPIVVDRKPVAFLEVDFTARHEFAADDHEYIHMLCSRAAQALSRTWWHEAADRARLDAESLKDRADAELLERQRTELALRASETRYRALATRTTRLHALTASLSVAASVKAVAQAIVDRARVVVGANEGHLTLTDDEDARFEPGLCSTEALLSREPVFVGSIAESHEKFWRSASEAADKGFASTAALPLMVNNAPVGVLEFQFSAPVNFDEEYQALLVSVAQHCAHALDRARLYEQAQRARADAETANRLKDEFVSTVSHELRTPLNAILGWASMLRTGSIESDVIPQAVDSIHRNASRQARLVDDLLDFSRMAGGRTSLDLETIDAQVLVRGIVESVIPLAAGNQVEIQLSEIPSTTLHADVRRLEQVFLNLLGNALKFTPAGGHIMVSGRITGRFLEIRVADDGIGIEPEFLPHVFDRFRQGDSTTTRNHSGLGLGLSIAKQLVEAHKGRISAESAGSGKGTAFTVSLPMSGKQAEEARDTAIAAADEPRLDGVRVLVVDDEKDARDVIERALEGRGARISVADNSSDAFAILERDEFDVLLADIAMPGEDGYSLIRKIRSEATRAASIPAAAVTAHARDDERSRALAAGFHVHLAKPIEPQALVRMVDHLTHERRLSRRSRA